MKLNKASFEIKLAFNVRNKTETMYFVISPVSI